jgi:steroid 5-alpha reductase family enzyme
MTISYIEALAAIATALAILMTGAWVVQQRTGNSGWVDAIWTFSPGLVGAGSALWPVAGTGDRPHCPSGWATLLAPAFVYWIPVYVTGIPPLEAQMLRSRGDRYRDYQSRTSRFFPLPPQMGVVKKGVVT